jgi:hypothetical protein
MSEREKVVLIRVLLSFVKDIRDGKTEPGPYEIQHRLRTYGDTTDDCSKGTLKRCVAATIDARINNA